MRTLKMGCLVVMMGLGTMMGCSDDEGGGSGGSGGTAGSGGATGGSAGSGATGGSAGSGATGGSAGSAGSDAGCSPLGPGGCYTCGQMPGQAKSAGCTALPGQLCGWNASNPQTGTASAAKFFAMLGCVCTPGNCDTVCSKTCLANEVPSAECFACFPQKCPNEVAACDNDDGTEPPVDGGSDSGDAATDSGSDSGSSDAASD